MTTIINHTDADRIGEQADEIRELRELLSTARCERDEALRELELLRGNQVRVQELEADLAARPPAVEQVESGQDIGCRHAAEFFPQSRGRS